nr:TonB-dependent receptor [Kofleriaceae bacterium]
MGATPNLSDEELAKLAEQEAKEEVIVVTGSTIERKQLTTPAPVTILNKQDLDATGRVTIGDILQQLPSQTNGTNAQVNNGGDGSTRVDLRGLGPERTLVLLNGRRIVPMGLGADSSIDLNSIPLAVVDRVEVLKDGASSVYGSDAISGVVNIITRKDFNGTEVTLYSGVAEQQGCNTAVNNGTPVDPNCGGPGFSGNGFTYDASFVTGHTSKKGNIMFSAGFMKADPVYDGDRPWSNRQLAFDFTSDCNRHMANPVAGLPPCVNVSGSSAVPNGFLDMGSITDPTGATAFTPSINCGMDGMGNLNVCINNGKGGIRAFQDSDLYNFASVNYLYTPSKRYNVYSEGHYDLTDNVDAFFEALYVNRSSDQQLAPEPFLANVPITGGLYADGTPINIFNPYNDGTKGQEEDFQDYRRRLVEFGPRTFDQSIDTFRIVAGLEGKLPENLGVFKDWKWELSYNYGRTDATQLNSGSLIKSHLAEAVGPSFTDSTGNHCGVSVAEGGAGDPGDGCIPINILGPAGSISSASKAYVTFTGVSSGFTDQRVALAQAHGEFVKTPWGGDLSGAFGADYRRESGAFNPDPLTATGDTTGNQVAPVEGSYDATEAFGELSFVPVANKKFAEWLEFDAAGRISHYNLFGNANTYKLSALYRTAFGVAIRGTYSTAFRAPSVSDLFSGQSDSFPSVEDPCDTAPPSLGGMTRTLDPKTQAECTKEGVPVGSKFDSSQQRSKVGGNPDLKPETATVATAGIVYEPLHGLAFTADYWNISIDQGIDALPTGTILDECYALGIQSSCGLITRNPVTHQIDTITDTEQNVAKNTTDGIDFSGTYDFTKKGIGRIRTSIEGTWLHKWDFDPTGENLPGTVIHAQGNFDAGLHPAFRGVLSSFWTGEKGFGAGLIGRYVGTYHECDPATGGCSGVPIDPTTGQGAPFRDVDRYYEFSIFGNYQFKSSAGTTTVTVGINNLFNTDPPAVYTAFANNTDGSVYDFYGRFYYVRLNQLF